MRKVAAEAAVTVGLVVHHFTDRGLAGGPVSVANGGHHVGGAGRGSRRSGCEAPGECYDERRA